MHKDGWSEASVPYFTARSRSILEGGRLNAETLRLHGGGQSHRARNVGLLGECLCLRIVVKETGDEFRAKLIFIFF